MAELRAPIVAVSGTVGSGKSVFAESLAEALEVPAHLEQVDSNPFFTDPLDQGVSAQLWFLTRSLNAVHEADGILGGVIERPPEEHLEIFARDLVDRQKLSAAEYQLLTSAYTAAAPLRAPDLLVYLEASPERALERVRERDRAGEESIDLNYLGRLASRYREFIRRWSQSPLLKVHTDALDVREADGFALVLSDVLAHLDRALPIHLVGGSLPIRAHAGDAGLDLACAEAVEIPPLERRVVSTGVQVHIPEGHVGLITPRSSLAVNHGVTQLDGPGVIDAGYRGPVHFLLYNTDRQETFRARAGERLGQVVIVPFAELAPRQVQGLSPSARGLGKFGSSSRTED
jgi:dUTP pyrophosphatase